MKKICFFVQNLTSYPHFLPFVRLNVTIEIVFFLFYTHFVLTTGVFFTTLNHVVPCSCFACWVMDIKISA